MALRQANLEKLHLEKRLLSASSSLNNGSGTTTTHVAVSRIYSDGNSLVAFRSNEREKKFPSSNFILHQNDDKSFISTFDGIHSRYSKIEPEFTTDFFAGFPFELCSFDCSIALVLANVDEYSRWSCVFISNIYTVGSDSSTDLAENQWSITRRNSTSNSSKWRFCCEGLISSFVSLRNDCIRLV